MAEVKKIRVLIVEDDESNRTVYDIFLKSAGDFEIQMAGDGREALSAIPEFQPDVIMLDLYMPGMDGFEFLRVYDGPVPIVIMSAWDMKAGKLPRAPYAFLAKPRAAKEIMPVLRDAAQSWRH